MKWMFRPIRFVFHGTGEIFSYLCGECVVNDYNARYLFAMGINEISVISMPIWKLTDNDFLMELLVGMFLLVVLFLFFAISQS